MTLPIHTTQTAATQSRPIFNAITQARGFVPNVYAVYGGLPDAMTGFAGLTSAFGNGSLLPAEREVIQLAVSVANRCRYCVAGHSAFAVDAELSDTHVQAMREGRDPDDDRLAALARFARKLTTDRGRGCSEEYTGFLAAGYHPDQALEVIIGVANKTLSNMTANLLDLPLDAEFAPYAWIPKADAA
ncbi:carboxymuconolactone decarboxylase family protein [uncultured Ruegeria sp.]|uniref:carboxymuconolactone decarboxylase family protein n=1 Tax=uncultured Ruegeria sp. TaxID=259304 RepID=UPI00263146D9|nr:carboxymuconolactone decarboxylase family protein [uncultured Ruegeria sp.]